jgi:hypothetical protein
MTTRAFIITLALTFTITATEAVDLNKLPSMDDWDWPKVAELKGRDLEAVEVALRQFRENHFSRSGDLRHFTIEVKRRGDKIAVAFAPDLDERSHRITPAENKYGVWVTYFVSLRTMRIVAYHFERD